MSAAGMCCKWNISPDCLLDTEEYVPCVYHNESHGGHRGWSTASASNENHMLTLYCRIVKKFKGVFGLQWNGAVLRTIYYYISIFCFGRFTLYVQEMNWHRINPERGCGTKCGTNYVK